MCKNRHKFANCNAIRIYHNGKIVAETSAALRRQNKLAPQSHRTLRNNKEKNYVSATPQAGALRHIKMAWPIQRANGSAVPRNMERAWKSTPKAALAFLWAEMQNPRKRYVNENE